MAEFDPDQISDALDRVVTSKEFSTSPQLRNMVSYLVKAVLDGEIDRIKGYSIGVDVLGRKPNFDASLDPIVRVQAHRLRQLLDTYYAGSGAEDPLIITIPKGSYRPEFVRGTVASPQPVSSSTKVLTEGAAEKATAKISTPKSEPAPDKPNRRENARVERSRDWKIVIAVLPLSVVSDDAAQLRFADGLVDEVTMAIARNPAFALAPRPNVFKHRDAPDLSALAEDTGAHFMVVGSLRQSGRKIRVNIQLVEPHRRFTLWTATFDRVVHDEFAVQEELAGSMASEIRSRIYTELKRAAAAKPSSDRDEFDLFLLATWLPNADGISLANELEHVREAREALRMAPNSGRAHSVLADKLAYLANVDPASDTEANRKAAAHHARKALEFDSGNADVIFNVAMHFWHSGQNSRCLSASRRVVELDPNHPFAGFVAKAVGYVTSEVPETVLDDLLAEDARIASDNFSHWITLSWLSILYANNGDFEKTVEMGMKARDVFSGRSAETTTWLAAALVQLGRTEAAVSLIQEIRESWPTLNLHHYAAAVVPRRYRGTDIEKQMVKLFNDLADQVAPEELRAKSNPTLWLVKGGKD